MKHDRGEGPTPLPDSPIAPEQPARKQRRRPGRIVSLRVRLGVLAILAMTLLITERIFSIINLHAENLHTAERQVLELTEQGASHFEKIMTGVRAIMSTLAANSEGIATDGNDCGYLNRVVETTSMLSSLSILDNEGYITCSSVEGGLGMDLSQRDYFRIALQGVGNISTVGRSYVTAAPSIYAALPVFSPGGTVMAVLVGRVALDDVFPRSVITTLDPQAQILMVDPDGVVIQAYPDYAAPVGENLSSNEAVSRAMSRTRGTVMAEGTDGIRRVYGFTRLIGTNVHLLVGIDMNRVTEAVEKATWRAASTLLLASFIIFLGLWIAGERLIVAPVQAIAQRLSRFGRGEGDEDPAKVPLITELQPLVVAFEAMASELTRRENALRSANRRLNSLASLDPLTGIANRRSFDSVLALQWSTVPKLAILMIDIDHFKAFNDRYGHGQGDECIRKVAQAMTATIRGTDIVARVGGEEFAVLMPGADLSAAHDVAQRLRQAIEQLGIPHGSATRGIVTVSIGCAAGQPKPGYTSAELLAAADKALYAAKDAGRNRVFLAA